MNKFCENCGKELTEGADVCTNCGKKITNKENNNKSKMPIWIIVLIVILCIGVISAIVINNIEKNSSNPSNNKTETKKESTYKVNEPFKFDNFEITIGDTISFTTIKNQFSEHNGKDVVKIPVTVKNIGKEENSLNMFYIKYFGSKKTELDDITTYFMDDCIEFGGELMPEASYTKYFYFLYDGDGTYTIKFDNWTQKINFKLNIKK